MRKCNKKIFMVIVITIVSCALLMSAHAEIAAVTLNSNLDFEYTYTGMSAEKAEMIVSSWKNGSSQYQGIMPANILCFFGHSITTGTIKQTYHNCSPTSPKCKEVILSVEYCGRDGCNYSKVLNETTYWLACH